MKNLLNSLAVVGLLATSSGLQAQKTSAALQQNIGQNVDDIRITDINNAGKLSTIDQDITVMGHNDGTIATKNGSISIVGDGLHISKMETSQGSLDGDIIVVNSQADSGDVTIVEFAINDILIQFKDKNILTERKSSSIEVWEVSPITVGSTYKDVTVLSASDEKIVLKFKNQKISLSLDGILVEKI